MVVVATLRLVAFFITFASDGGGALIVSCAEITEQALVRKQSRATGLLQFQSKKNRAVAENRAQKRRPISYLYLDEDGGEGVCERDVTKGLQRAPYLLRRGDSGADADSGEAPREPAVCCTPIKKEKQTDY
jgi:hypothetical protein